MQLSLSNIFYNETGHHDDLTMKNMKRMKLFIHIFLHDLHALHGSTKMIVSGVNHEDT